MTTDLRLLSAVKVSSSKLRFVLSDDAKSCYFHDVKKKRFVHIDFATETETEFVVERFKEINKNTIWSNFIDISSTDKTKFLATVFEKDSGKMFIVLFSANVLQRKVSICAEHWTGLSLKLGEKQQFRQLYKSNEGDIYSIAYFINETLKTTDISVCKIRLMGSVDITSAVIFDGKTVDGLWFSPFVADNAIHLLSWDESVQNKIIKIPFDGANYFTIPMSCTCASCKNGQGHSISNAVFSYVSAFDERFFFVVNDGENIDLVNIKLCSTKRSSSSSTKFCMSIEEQLMMKTSDHMLKFIDLQISSNGTAFFGIESTIYQQDLYIMASQYKTGKEVLGEGTYGSVVKGTLTDHEEVAVKIMKDSPTEPVDFRRKLLLSAVAEAKKLKMIDHKNIVKTFGYIIEEHRFLLFLELMQESVRDRILRTDEKRLPEKESLVILQQALEGLVHLHTLKPKPIVHRDLKCANLLIQSSGVVKLGDFGLVTNVLLNSSGSTDPEYAPKGRTGTAYWQAPEVLSDALSYGRKADVWSIGCCLVEMLTGYPPFVDMGVMEWAIKAHNGTLVFDPKILVPMSATNSIFLLEKTFRRATKEKQQRDQEQNIRPHSWEILANVADFNVVKPLQQERLSLHRLISPIQQKLTPLQSRVTPLQEKLKSIEQQRKLLEQQRKSLDQQQEFIIKQLEPLQKEIQEFQQQLQPIQQQLEPLEQQLESEEKFVNAMKNLSLDTTLHDAEDAEDDHGHDAISRVEDEEATALSPRKKGLFKNFFSKKMGVPP